MYFPQFLSTSSVWITRNIYSLAVGIVVLLVGWYLSRLVSRTLHHLVRRAPNVDRTLAPLAAEAARYAVLAITLVIVLGQFGVQTASILAILGAVGLAIALALQGTLSNMAAGVMLLWLRPFNVGEYIDAEGVAGTVVGVGIFGTRLRTFDGLFIFAPNQRLWNARLINYSREPTRLIDTPIGIAYEASIEKARIVLLGVARESKALADPAPSVFVSGLGDSSVNLVLRVWAKNADWWEVKTTLAERVKTSLDAAGIEIPYRKVDLNVKSTAMPVAENAPPS